MERMTENHPIRPPHELVQQWVSLAGELEGFEIWQDLATQAARWGADQELEACCDYLARCAAWEPEDVREMLDFLRPKPPSLKEQALTILDDIPGIDGAHYNTLRRALEQLDD